MTSSSSGVEVHATITFSTAAGDVKVGLQVGVRDRIASAPSSVDLGLDLDIVDDVDRSDHRSNHEPANGRRPDVCGGDCVLRFGRAERRHCRSSPRWIARQSRWLRGVDAGRGHRDGVERHARERSLSGQHHPTSPMGTFTIPVAFSKGYGVRIDSPTTPAALAVSSASSGLKTSR